MKIPLSEYYVCGQRAAEALNVRDGAKYQLQHRWYLSARSQEVKGDRSAAIAEYEKGYAKHRLT